MFLECMENLAQQRVGEDIFINDHAANRVTV